MDTNVETRPEKAKKKQNQPKHHAVKSPLTAKRRRQEIIKAVVDGKPLRETGIRLGLAPKSAQNQVSQILKHPDTQKSFIRILESSGLDDAFLSSRLRDLADASGSHFFNVDGEIVEKHSPAHETRRKTLEMVCRLKGHLKEHAQTDISVGLMSVVLQTIHQPQPA